MNAALPSARQLRVLGIFPHRRFAGHAVLDEVGLVRAGTFMVDVRRHGSNDERGAAIERRVRSSIATYRPDLLVIVSDADAVALEDAAIAHDLPVRRFREREVGELFAQTDASRFDQLGQAVTGAFFSELLHRGGSWALGSIEQRRLRRPVWKAAAGAIAALAEARPHAVLKLARNPLPQQLASLIERASRTPAP